MTELTEYLYSMPKCGDTLKLKIADNEYIQLPKNGKDTISVIGKAEITIINFPDGAIEIFIKE